MTLFLIGLGVTVFYTGSLYFWPYRPCSRCGGTGRNRGSTAKRYGKCRARRCDRGTVQRYGSKTVHRAVRALVDYKRKEK